MFESIVWPMPDLDLITENLHGATWFASLDAFKVSGRSPYPDSHEMFSIITSECVYTPTRLLQGTSIATAVFQAEMSGILQGILSQH